LLKKQTCDTVCCSKLAPVKEAVAQSQKSTSTNTLWTPLKLISAFVGVIDTVITVGITQTAGGVQIALTAFVVGFTSLVAFGFFFLLWHKPEVLLTQPTFKSAAEGAEYIAALRGIVTKAESDANSIYASAEEMKLLASQTKVSYEAIEGLETKLQTNVKMLEEAIKKSEQSSFAKAYFLSGGG
jgi:hypothetical protein